MTINISENRNTLFNNTDVAIFRGAVENATRRAVLETQTAYEQAASRNMETTLAIKEAQSPSLGNY